MPPPPRATLFPYTTLFRSKNSTEGRIDGVRELRQNREEQSERPLQRAIDEQGLGARPRSIISAYIALTKPRVIELLLVTTAPVMFLAAHGLPNICLVINTLIDGAAAAASASVFKCYVDRVIDAKMALTKG